MVAPTSATSSKIPVIVTISSPLPISLVSVSVSIAPLVASPGPICAVSVKDGIVAKPPRSTTCQIVSVPIRVAGNNVCICVCVVKWLGHRSWCWLRPRRGRGWGRRFIRNKWPRRNDRSWAIAYIDCVMGSVDPVSSCRANLA